MKWHNETRKVGELIPYEHNPRHLTEKQHADLTRSLKKFDLAEVPAINTDDMIIAGHQRLKILMELYGPDHEIDVRVPDKKLTKKQFEEYLIRSNKNTGEWDYDVLANAFDVEELQDWGFDKLDYGECEDENQDNQTESGPNLKVDFSDSQERDDLFAELKERGFEVKKN